jgi:hypothetical protein
MLGVGEAERPMPPMMLVRFELLIEIWLRRLLLVREAAQVL